MLGFAAHVLTDVNDSIGTMMLFPVTTLNWSLHTWAYAATVKGGKYLDAAAYFSSLGFAMDMFWLLVVLAQLAGAHLATSGAPTWYRPTRTCGHGSASGSTSAASWRSTAASSSTACAG